MFQQARDTCLMFELLDVPPIGCPFVLEPFHGDRTPQLGIHTLVNNSHAPLAEFPLL